MVPSLDLQSWLRLMNNLRYLHAMDLKQDTFCSFCGAKFSSLDGYPRRCDVCNQQTFRNPSPVAVLLVPVLQPTGRLSVITVRRGIQPGYGELALPGGFLELGETWQVGAAREFFEETTFKVDPAAIKLIAAHSVANDTLLLFGESPPLAAADLNGFFPNEEVQELVVVERPVPMAFELHETIMADFFTRVGY